MAGESHLGLITRFQHLWNRMLIYYHGQGIPPNRMLRLILALLVIPVMTIMRGSTSVARLTMNLSTLLHLERFIRSYLIVRKARLNVDITMVIKLGLIMATDMQHFMGILIRFS